MRGEFYEKNVIKDVPLFGGTGRTFERFANGIQEAQYLL